MTQILFRVDSSNKIGSGHLMRCLSLAKLLREKGHKCTFLVKKLPGDLNCQIDQNRFSQITINQSSSNKKANAGKDQDNYFFVDWEEEINLIEPAFETENFDWVVVDHYGLDENWHKSIKKHVNNVFVIDDLFNRPLYCDVILNQNIDAQLKSYEGLLPVGAKFFGGPSYAILKKEFYELSRLQKPRETVKNILVCFGGNDVSGETLKFIQEIENLDTNSFRFKIVLIDSHPTYKSVIEISSKKKNIEVLSWVKNIQELMAWADLGFGAGGTSMYERFFMGLPTVVVATAENQYDICLNAQKKGLIYLLGSSFKNEKYSFRKFFRENLDKVNWVEMSKTCLSVQPSKIEEVLEVFNGK